MFKVFKYQLIENDKKLCFFRNFPEFFRKKSKFSGNFFPGFRQLDKKLKLVLSFLSIAA
jgi:hypothetical protein